MNFTSIVKPTDHVRVPSACGYTKVEQRRSDTNTKFEVRRCINPERGEEVQIEVTISKLDRRGNWRNTYSSVCLKPEQAQAMIDALATMAVM